MMIGDTLNDLVKYLSRFSLTAHVYYDCELYAWYAISIANISYFLICDRILQFLCYLVIYANDFIYGSIYIVS